MAKAEWRDAGISVPAAELLGVAAATPSGRAGVSEDEIGSLLPHEYDIERAISRLFSGT